MAAARGKALESVQKAMVEAKQKIANGETCKLKAADGSRSGVLHMPQNGKNGTWAGGAQPADGNGVFQFAEPKTLPDGRQVASVTYRDGAPVLDDVAVGQKHALWEVTGDVGKDETQLKAMKRQTEPGWQPPNPEIYVLHHFEDGAVGYVPRVIHDKAIGGVARTGGNSMLNAELFRGDAMIQVTDDIKQGWLHYPPKKATDADILALEAAFGATLPAQYVAVVKTYGFVKFGYDKHDTRIVTVVHDGDGQRELRQATIVFLVSPERALQTWRTFTYKSDPDAEDAPLIPDGYFPAANDNGQGLLLIELATGRIWYWRESAWRWGIEDNTRLGFVAEDFDASAMPSVPRPHEPGTSPSPPARGRSLRSRRRVAIG